MTTKKRPYNKKSKPTKTDILNQMAEKCLASQEAPEVRLRRVEENYNTISDKFYPLREMFFELEQLVKLTGTINEAAFNKLFVKHRVKL